MNLRRNIVFFVLACDGEKADSRQIISCEDNPRVALAKPYPGILPHCSAQRSGEATKALRGF